MEDTDSMAIVATESGGVYPVLVDRFVRQMVGRE
jgi:hypothetical protein